jgi:hypothetical protein
MNDINRYAANGDPWWLLLLRAYAERDTEGRLGFAYLAAARARLFGEDADAEDCLDEIRADAVRGMEVHYCASSKELVLGINPYGRFHRPAGLRLAASAEAELKSEDLEAACRGMVVKADSRLRAGTPSAYPTLEGYVFRPFDQDDLEMIDAVGGELSRATPA